MQQKKYIFQILHKEIKLAPKVLAFAHDATILGNSLKSLLHIPIYSTLISLPSLQTKSTGNFDSPIVEYVLSPISGLSSPI